MDTEPADPRRDADVDDTRPIAHTAPTPPPAADQPAHQSPQAPGPSAGDRVWSLRTVVAAAITAVALSGVGGAALAAASDGGSDQGGRPGRGGFGGPPGTNGQLPGRGPGPNGQQQLAPGTGAGTTGSARTT